MIHNPVSNPVKVTGLLFLLSCLPVIPVSAQQPAGPAGFVNPFIGTGGHGHTFPGASVPFGMVQLSPDTRLTGWDGCSAYHGSDTVIYGFSHTHLSGTGCSDYGDILIMPVSTHPEMKDYGYASPFSKAEESASPGYYRVRLKNGGIIAELTATSRAGMHRYSYRSQDENNIVIDLKHRDKVLESGIRVTGTGEVEGYRFSRDWAEKQMIFFVAKFSKPLISNVLYSNDRAVDGASELSGENLKALLSFGRDDGRPLVVKVGISAVSVEGARKNLEEGIPGWDFDAVAASAADAWNKELGKIEVTGENRDKMSVFYTALYHTLLQPNLYSDADGQYRGRDLQVHRTEGFDYYTVFSLWDTYRAAHPLYTIIETKRTGDFINTFLKQYEQGGMLPVWELSSNETGCMIGYHSVPVIADAWLKGIQSFDGAKALEAMKHSASQDNLGLKYYKSKGYIPADREGESVSKTLEYAYDDWCIAKMAKALGKEDDYRNYLIRAQNYKNMFDPISGFMRAKSNETWFSPFDPAEVNFNYTEANAWQYSFYVPQDLSGLMGLMGGRDNFISRLDALFAADTKTTGRNQADITGLIGQYAHGNEPSHHMAYLYDYAGTPWKTQELVHRIASGFYTNSADGLIGNEDCGQMSAWYVLSALGFYPVTPASGIYAIGTPSFEKAVINLEDGKVFTVRAIGISDQNFYIQSATLNGKPLTRCFINHSEIIKGGEMVFRMGPQPNKAWGSGFGSFPESWISEFPIVPVPAVHQGERTFRDSTVVGLSCALPGVVIRYTLDGSEPGLKSNIYLRPLVLRKTTTLRAMAFNKELNHSFPIEARFIRIPANRSIRLNTHYAGQYSAGGELALIDFITGGDQFMTGTWQGYEGVDIDAVVDLGSVQPVKRLAIGCLQNQGSWIFMPQSVTWSLSDDGVNFSEAGKVMNDVEEHREGAVVNDFSLELKGKARYVRVVAKNRGTCPDWHPGAGQKAWIFADEITIE